LLVSKKAEWKNIKNKLGQSPYKLAQELNFTVLIEFFQLLESEVPPTFSSPPQKNPGFSPI